MKVYMTDHVFTEGIREVDADPPDDDNPYRHRTREEAVAHAVKILSRQVDWLTEQKARVQERLASLTGEG